MRVGDGRIVRRRPAHVDQAARTGRRLIGLDHCNVFQSAGRTVADQPVAVQRAGKIGTIQAITRFEDVEHAQDAARFAGMGDLDVDALEERLLLEQRGEFRAVDSQYATFNRRNRTETDVFNVNAAYF